MLFITTLSAAQERQPPVWPEVGRVQLEVLWFDIYEASLFAPNAKFSGFSAPLLLQVEYLRDFKAEMIVQETDKQLKPFASQEQRQRWLPQLSELWPDIRQGDQLAFEIAADGHGHFYFNRRWLGHISEPEFVEAFVKIWLSPDGEYPALASQLRGEQ
ncbi:chalcone isomerase family protein [Pontibacter sp. JAM-7]|uniref:chalcone isomerase family protein n=1 Tax=Pontibacter sp. JAM-7 TaxID=3366581 RepID=UPI003AF7B171